MGLAGQIIFSEGTYQVEVDGYWPFLQIDDNGNLLDSFCTCEGGDRCEHLQEAFSVIYKEKGEALHVRFRRSIWHHLCLLAARRHGYEPNALTKDENIFLITSDTGKRLFFAKPLTESGFSFFDEFVFGRPIETEETSLKFSNLAPEELALWKKGTPSDELKYELSFWSDLAKWLFLMQEKEMRYHVETKGKPLPNGLIAHFPDVRVGFYIAKVNWNELVPSLNSIESELKVQELYGTTVKNMSYDEEKQVIVIDSDQLPKVKAKREVIALGEWSFAEDVGFFPSSDDPLFHDRVIPKEKLSYFLTAHHQTISRFILIHFVSISYSISFTKKHSLEISTYMSELQDLASAHFFGSWAFVSGKGFYHLEGLHFETPHQTIKKEEVGDFVSRHRHWLSSFEGFATHLSDVESHLIYYFNEDGSLIFDTEPHFSDEPEEIIDLREWIYVRDRGFYHKHGGRLASPITPGLCVPKDEIGSFIENHKDELESVKNFFLPRSPLTKAGLSILVDDEDRIVVDAHFESELPLTFFGSYLFAEGFYELPQRCRLPEGYEKRKVIAKSKEAYFITSELPRLIPFTIELDRRLTQPKKLQLHLDNLAKSSDAPGREWVATLTYRSELGEATIEPFFTDKSYIMSDAGLIFLKNSRFSWLSELNSDSHVNSKLTLTTLEWIRLNIYEELAPAESTMEVLEELKAFKTPLPLSYPMLKSTLRPYQELGAQWLWFLYSHGLSGMLCDEMGLGKTHQAMALIAGVHNLRKRKYLIVCPTSVIYHWESLLTTFLPSLRFRTFYGQKRTLDLFAQKADILLTSYGIMRQEREVLSEINFEVAIFDELQLAKNVHSQTHKGLKKLKCKTRIGLTGTPIENRLLELKALFDVVLPTYLPPLAKFREHFITPIEKHQDPEKKKLLMRMTSPFLLRRKKSEVLDDLPEKIEEVLYCDLSKHQKELYKSFFEKERRSVVGELEQDGPVPTMHIFAILSKLKQICDHPVLITKDMSQVSRLKSGKWDLFLELLAETRDSGQKVVIFSQYLGMLTIIENHLREKNIGFATIRGATRDRKAQLERFAQDPNCEVFVASLQAAGVGIDLTAASVVIHYDRWWNPAKENQATDRVHRIGQKRGVQVFKLVTKNSVEEHIHALIERKSGLIDSVIGYDDQDQLKTLSRDELIALFHELENDLS